jgi:hypothetical protein
MPFANIKMPEEANLPVRDEKAAARVALGLLGVPFSGLCDKFQAAAPSRALVT